MYSASVYGGSCLLSIFDYTSSSVRNPSPMTVKSFQGKYRFLSNFYPAAVFYRGLTFPTVEHAYQASKSLDETEQRRIAQCPTPGDAKRLGRQLTRRPDFDEVKLSIMFDLVSQKFTRHPQLTKLLLETGDDELVEGNTWNDIFWGVYNGQGKNHLGKILMKVRDDLRKGGSLV